MKSSHIQLIKKYDVPVPRYTSYPTLPFWQRKAPSKEDWLQSLNQSLRVNPQVSLYIHLPFCERLCTYCGCNKRITKNHSVEEVYIKSLLAEWRVYLEAFETTPQIVELHLGGGTPTFFSPKNLESLIESLLKPVQIADHSIFSFEAHPSSTTFNHLKTLRSLGFKRLSVGVQDVSEDILQAIHRFQNLKQIDETISTARKLGYGSVNYDIIYGLPFQKEQHISDTMLAIQEHKPDRIAFYSYAHVPWKSKGQRAYTLADIPQGVNKYKLKLLGHEKLTRMGYLSIGMDHYALPSDSLLKAKRNKTLHRNFMGYTDTKTHNLIGLGCSAISEISDMYIQNEKEVEIYYSRVDDQKIPILKGHQLNREQRVVKRHLTELFCQEFTSWKKGTLADTIFNLNSDILADMVVDGLVLLQEKSVSILPKGRDFVRNICAALDPFQETNTQEGQFSRAI